MTRRKDLTSETKPDTFNVELEARRRGIQPYQVRAIGAVDDKLMADIVNDFRRGIPQSASMIPDSKRSAPVTKGNGWQEATPLGPQRGINVIDRMVENDTHRKQLAAIQEELTNREIERRLAGDDNKIQSEFDPFSRENMKK